MFNKLRILLLKARKEQDTLRVSVLGFLISAVQNKEISLRGKGEALTDEHVAEVLKKQIKQHNESIEQYKMGNRQDLVDKEASELKILEEIQNENFK